MAITSKIAPDTASPSIEDIEAQLAELRKEIASLTRNLAAYGSAKVDDTVSASIDAINAAKQEALSMEDAFEQQVRARPLQSIGIALGVGFVAALLTRR